MTGAKEALAAIDDAVRRGDAAALAAYARTAEAGGNLGVAAALWQKAIAARPSPDFAASLAQALEKGKADADALAIYEQVLKLAPALTLLHIKAGEAAARLERMGDARRHYRNALALAPGDAKVAMAFSDTLWDDGLDEAAAAIKTAADANASNAAERARLLARHTLVREMHERYRRGLPLHHAIDWKEFPFAFALDAVDELDHAVARWLEEDPRSVEALMYRTAARLARSDYAGADATMKALAALYPAEPKFQMRFVRPDLKEHKLPEVMTLARAKSPNRTALFLSCDDGYLKAMAAPLLASLRRKSPGTGVRLHVMTKDPTAALKVVNGFDDLAITLTTEDPSAVIRKQVPIPGLYYGAVRFVRFYEALAASDDTLCMMDADGLVNADLSRLFSPKQDAAFRVRSGRLEPWNLFSACLVMGRPNARARAYYREVARIITGNIDRLWWGIDQYAMYAAWVYLKTQGKLPSIGLYGPDDADIEDYRPASSIWFTAGSVKAKMNMPKNFAEGTPRRRYAEAFSRYVKEAAAAVG